VLITYTGNKTQKTIGHLNKIYVFTPDCEVENQATINYLLHRDMQGLFIESVNNKSEGGEVKATAKKPTKARKKKKGK